MSNLSKDQDSGHEPEDDEVEVLEYKEMILLERLETLREDMEDLGVTTLSEVVQRIEELHQLLDAR
jgi:hypothetical protein